MKLQKPHTYIHIRTQPNVYLLFYSSSDNNEGKQHRSIMLTVTESFYNPNSYRSSADDLDKESAINSCHSDRNHNSCPTNVDSLDVAECDINITLDIPTVYQHANGVLVKNSNRKMDDNIEFVSQNTINSHNTAKSSQISQDESREDDVTSVPKMVTKMETLKHPASNKYQYNDLCCKISIVFAICWIIGCCLIPVILFYASQATDRDYAVTDPGYSHEKNISSATVSICCKLSVQVC